MQVFSSLVYQYISSGVHLSEVSSGREGEFRVPVVHSPLLHTIPQTDTPLHSIVVTIVTFTQHAKVFSIICRP